jgi:hypothetical protein
MKKTSIAVLLCTAPLWAQADGWEYSISPYLWLPTISLDSSNVRNEGGPIDGSSLDVGPTDYLQALNFGLMLSGDMRKNDWVLMGDLIYLDLGIDDKDIDFARPGTGPIAGRYNAGLSGSVITFAGGRAFVKNNKYDMEGLVGWRRVGMSLEVSGDLDSGDSFDVRSDLNFNDAFIGVNGRYGFANDNWSLRYYGDIGAGDSDLTWQAMLEISYGFDWGDFFVNYRHLHYDFGDAGRFNDLETTFSGPSVGAAFRF